MSRPFSEERWNDEFAAERIVLVYPEGSEKPDGIYLLDTDNIPVMDPLDRLEARAFAYRLLRLSDYLPEPKPLPTLRRLAEVDDALRDLEG
jgi:hypothetical protein